jgi:hypothetical protein
MGLATLNVWIADREDPCRMSDEEGWHVVVVDCGRRLVKWCELENPTRAKCGHADITLPPGCYIVFAAKSWDIIGSGEVLAKDVTQATRVTVSCDDNACVHLYTSQERMCWPRVIC